MDPALFVPDVAARGTRLKTIDPRAAIACRSCGVAVECAQWAVGDNETGVVAGGQITDGQRHRVLPRVIKCGTTEGYRGHRYRGEDACTDCLDAHARYEEFSPRNRRSA